MTIIMTMMIKIKMIKIMTIECINDSDNDNDD